jgi:lysozyme
MTTPYCTEDALLRDEGVRLKPYRDSVGKLTIGIGRNLDDVGISLAEARMLLANDLEKVQSQISASLPWVRNLSVARQSVVENMAFNLGVNGLMAFKETLAWMEAGNYSAAADAMLQSVWARQVGVRAERLAAQMRTGEWQ